MKPSIHVLYLSGFGNKYDPFRLKALRLWRYEGISVELVPMRWEGNETFEQKIARIDQAIDRAKNKKVVLLGESAGGSMAVHMYARRSGDFYKVMTICGKNANPGTVGEEYYQRSPAFRTSMEKLDESTSQLTKSQRQNFVSIYPLYDSVVPAKDTLLADCKRARLWSFGHLFTIFLALTLLSPFVVAAAARKRR